MKILHTADWHIGKVLHKHPLHDELALFFEWLIDVIDSHAIDVLLISGDIFDLANPSAKDRQMYFGLLTRLNRQGLKVIITGGNHDSVGLLNAPKDILDILDISVIGGATEHMEDEIIEIKSKEGQTSLLVAAVPFLRDKDLRNRETDEKYKSRTEAIREGIKEHYQKIFSICKEKNESIPVIAMGHLYAIGADRSESERDIHVGNAAAIDSLTFPAFDYVALGHIHRPQVINRNIFFRYSGSPIALSFSEKKDHKSVVILHVDKGIIQTPEVVEIPKFRELKKFSGDFKTVKSKLSGYSPSYPLESFVEIEVNEGEFSALLLSQVEDLQLTSTEDKNYKILKRQTHFTSGTRDTADLFEAGENIEDLSPMEVFAKKMEVEGLDTEKMESMKEIFVELMELIEQAEPV